MLKSFLIIWLSIAYKLIFGQMLMVLKVGGMQKIMIDDCKSKISGNVFLQVTALNSLESIHTFYKRLINHAI